MVSSEKGALFKAEAELEKRFLISYGRHSARVVLTPSSYRQNCRGMIYLLIR
jgi:hypothetical protein